MTEMKEPFSDPEESWARVELFRHQYGELPNSADERKLDVKVAAVKMAQAVADGKVDTFNAAMVIGYLQTLIPDLNTDAAESK